MSLAQFGRDQCALQDCIRPVHLTPMERDVLAALLAHDPKKAVTVDRLVELVYPDPFLEPEFASSAVKVTISRLRNKGVQVLCEEGRGYFILR